MKIIRKYINIVLFCSVGMLLFNACTKYVDKEPLDAFSDLDYWNSEDNVKTFAWGFYNDLIIGFGSGTNGNFYFTSFNDDQADPTFQQFPKNVPASDGNWSFGDIRKANLMISRVKGMDLDEATKNHWVGIARFFRAWSYFRLVKRFGDVPWYSQVPDVSQDSLIYKARDSRDLVMDSVLSDLDFAIAHLRSKGEADPNTVNKDVALALKSRICLFAGTWAEYNQQDDSRAIRFLKESKKASDQIMQAGYILSDNYKDVYSSYDLSGNTEVILYKHYEEGVLTHSTVGYTNATTEFKGLTKSAIESYVCTDGLPIKLSSKYKGDDDIHDLRANRDERLLHTVDNFYCYLGHLRGGGMKSSTGFRPTKFLPDVTPAASHGDTIEAGDTNTIPYNYTDAPVFWLAETLENYAEACAELDKLGAYKITQNDVDESVNLLRERANVADLELDGNQGTAVNGTPFVDPDKDPDVTSLIWEIRRDRRVELMMDGFRLADLLRWHKLEYMDPQKNPDAFLGAKVTPNDDITLNGDGYIEVYPDHPDRPVGAKYYLWPIPSGQIALYPDGVLKQNPGW